MKKWECTVCGYIHEGDAPPDTCPVCGAGAEYFKELVDESVPADSSSIPKPSVSQAAATAPQPAVDGIAGLVLKYHLHPISVHTPNGVLPLALVFLVIALVFSVAGFEQAAFYNLVFVLISMPVVLVTGYLEWKNRYKRVMTKIFATKIAASAVVSATLIAMIVWRLVDPQVLVSPGRWIFLLLGAVMVAAVGLAGHMGGKLVFKD
jgi:rubredoxin/uncharacterized membrane protein